MDKFELEKSKNSNVQKTVRFPEELCEQIEKIVNDKNNESGKNLYSFNGFVISACKFAIKNM